MQCGRFDGRFHTYNRYVGKGRTYRLDGCCRGRVAGYGYHLAVLRQEKTRNEQAPVPDFFYRKSTVWTKSGIGNIYKALPGEKRLNVFVNTQPTYPGIHYSNG